MHLTQGLHKSIQMTPDAVACVFRNRRRTYRELGDRVARLAAGFCGLGLQTGERIGMLSLNSDRFLEYMLAGWWAGAVLNPVNIRWSVREIVYSLDDCDTGYLVIDDHHLPLADELCARAKRPPVLIYAGDGETPAGMHNFEQLIAASAPMEDSWRGGEDLAVIMYTGGTTGLSKGVMLSHRNLWSGAMMRQTTSQISRDSMGLVISPMFHVAGMALVASRVIAGVPSTFIPFFDAIEVLETIQRERINEIMFIPAMLQATLAHPRLAEYDLSSLRRISYGASPINATVLERAMEVLPGIEFVHAYGMTEIGGVATLNMPEDHSLAARANGRSRSVGRAIHGLQLMIVDPQGHEVPRGTVGEVLLRGPSVMQGYWRKPEETAQALQHGWLYTGDAAYMDADGYVFIVDRVKDMIISGGENVYSAEVENVLAKHPDVAQCAVIGIPHEQWGEAVHAVVTLKPGASADEDALRAHCREFIAGYKCPKSVEFRDTLPLSGAGKIIKRDLREPFWKGKARSVN
ncbi:long-chain-fatty-acid--CoA ligase [Pseudomonas sp. H9]|uniref:long-chain-fatty-acid--CoA ligase n=1 Tax=Pseudomonas sp. H9 TaxID=483968 RepID=UPI0010583749|nr:long-chain-fatty-acid--CoA ligase [Pseudomonas sp. H9]TDF83857.1 long-chain-fatty-acid--CoA ligase [Pseudomonas sp. H9]